MIELYHGSPVDFDGIPNLSKGRSYRDFGIGFYLAEDKIDATRMALKDSDSGFVYIYEVDDSALLRLRSLVLDDGYDEKWARIIYDCRMNGSQSDYDVIVGNTAGLSVNALFEQYRRNSTPFEEVKNEILRKAVGDRFGVQWCLATPTTLSYIQLIEKEPFSRYDDIW